MAEAVEVALEPFVDFKIGGVSSAKLGIIRTSDGSRYNENLLPTIQDKTVQIPGGDGMYYFGSYYTQRQFSIPIAFDNMNQEQHDDLIKIMGEKKLQDLEFAERPGVVYKVKSTGSPQIKWICFDEGEGSEDKRTYKGEGTLNFVAYDPFGRKKITATGTGEFDFKNNGMTKANQWMIEIETANLSRGFNLYNVPVIANDINLVIGDGIVCLKRSFPLGYKEGDSVIEFEKIKFDTTTGLIFASYTKSEKNFWTMIGADKYAHNSSLLLPVDNVSVTLPPSVSGEIVFYEKYY